MNDDKKVDQLEIALFMLQLVTGGQQSAEVGAVQAAPKLLDLDVGSESVPGRGKKGW